MVAGRVVVVVAGRVVVVAGAVVTGGGLVLVIVRDIVLLVMSVSAMRLIELTVALSAWLPAFATQ